MNIFFVMQIISIAGVATVLIYCRHRMLEMEYGFIKIIARLLIFKDFRPLTWLSNNLEYLGFLMLFIGHFFTIIGLLQQLGNGEIYTKLEVFFLSSPTNNFGLVLTLFSIAKKRYFARVY
jgi:hypothetical protein